MLDNLVVTTEKAFAVIFVVSAYADKIIPERRRLCCTRSFQDRCYVVVLLNCLIVCTYSCWVSSQQYVCCHNFIRLQYITGLATLLLATIVSFFHLSQPREK